jgi:hypothetical protein
MAKKKAPPVTSTGHRKEFIDLLNANARRHDLWRVFSDFVEMAAIAISNSMDIYRRADRETRYMEIVKAYDAEELRRFAEALAALTMALELSEFDDMLGSVFMELGLGNKWHGQFFTPYHLCHMMGMMTLGDKDPRAAIAGKGYVVVNDPCIGGGAMIIGLAHAMKDSDINFQQCMYAVCQDVDIKAVHMAYVQLSLLGIPAVVIHGNSLALEERSRWYTPLHFVGGWDWRLQRGEQPARDTKPQEGGTEIPIPETEPAEAVTAIALPVPDVRLTPQQFSLFEEAA